MLAIGLSKQTWTVEAPVSALTFVICAERRSGRSPVVAGLAPAIAAWAEPARGERGRDRKDRDPDSISTPGAPSHHGIPFPPEP